jgi:hypothetical protein
MKNLQVPVVGEGASFPTSDKPFGLIPDKCSLVARDHMNKLTLNYPDILMS